ncbi:MAG: phospholipid scramblase-related protein [Phycisphaerae bacterium]
MHSSLADLADGNAISVRQKKEWGEILTGWETKNRYEVSTAGHESLFFAGEVGTSFLSRHFLGGRRPFTIEVKDNSGATALVVRRPWRWFFPYAEVFDGDGRKLGAVQRRWAWLSRRYDLQDDNGHTVAQLHGPVFRPWTFRIMVDGRESGRITKKWSGLLKESFTKADNFGVQFDGELDLWFRAVCLGATFLIDFVHFERKKR